MNASGSLIVIVVGLLIAAFLSATIGMIVAIVGVVGLVISLVNGSRSSSVL